MKTNLTLAFLLLVSASVCAGQKNNQNISWDWLIGKWAGEGSGKPGSGTGSFTFAKELDGRIITRKSHTEFPRSEGRPESVHDDLMVIYADPTDAKQRAVYFDNEGHTIFYSINITGDKIVLTSDKIPDSPAFRLIYEKTGDAEVNVIFEMSADGGTFKPYLEGRSRRADH